MSEACDVLATRRRTIGAYRALISAHLVWKGEGPWRRVLAYDETCKKLVGVYGYPEEILDFQYDHTYMVRGLVVDKRRGNILKMDRHKYVKVAHHGFRPLAGRLFLARRFLLRCRASLRSPRASRSKKSPCSASKPRGACRPYRSASEKRLATYCDTAKVDQFDGADYANVDTLFSLGETYLFCQLVELKEKAMEQDPDSMIARKSFYDMYNEIRASVDLCHRDGSLKRAVALDPAKYIHRDDALVPMLRALRASGKKTFLLTNSLWDFTNVVMNYLVADAKGEKKTTEWMELFDAVITGSCKPGFFENERAGIFAVDVDSGTLHNTDDGAPMTPIGASKAASAADDAMGRLGSDGTKAYQGGSYRHLHAMLGISSGNKVLYVGDHIYGDILRSKKTLGWRTMLVVPELAHEMECLEKAEEAKIPARLRQLQQRRDRLADALQLAAWRREKLGGEQVVGKDYEVLLAKADSAREEHRQEMRELHAGFHRVWGQMMKAGNQNSRFAHQLERYACLYTSHARNLVAYSPAKSYRGLSDSMPHDLYQDE